MGVLLRWIGVGLAGLVSLVTVAGAGRLVLAATAAEGTPPGVPGQLSFLRGALDAGSGDQAQRLFPEGYFFLHVLYGLTWVELGQREPDQRAVAVREARWVLDRLDSPSARAPFSPELEPAYGVFYRGWTNWLRGGMLGLQPPAVREPAQLRRFEEDSAALGAAFDAAATPYLPAYPGQAWPCDSTVAVASLRLHDALLTPRYQATVTRWLSGVRSRLDPETGLMPHRVDPADGTPAEVARATSQSIIHRFLVDIDSTLAREQYLRFRERFVTWPLGLGPAVREYPSGVDGTGDVDSGPLVLGVSLSATAVTLGAAQVDGDHALAGALANYGEVAGVPIVTPGTKRYALGALPIGDAFLAWSKTARPWVATAQPAPPETVGWWWRVPLLLVHVVVVVVVWVPFVIWASLRPWRRLSRSGEQPSLPA